MSAADVQDRRRLGDLGPRVGTLGLGVGVVALVISVIVAFVADHGMERFFRSYLTAFMFVLSICLGALFFVAIQHATRAGWSVVIRRIAEGVMSNLRWIWILFIPILYAMFASDSTHLYHWAMSDAGSDEILVHKRPYLNPLFWTIRAAVFFGVWALLARLFCNASVEQDRTGDVQITHRLQWFAPIAIILYALTQSYASIDWIKSTEPHWFSTMFGVYFFAGSACAFFSVQIILTFILQRSGRILNEVSLEHYQDMGKQLFAFGIVFWAYIGFSQFMLIWYANIPEETAWFIARTIGGWLGITVLLLFGHFVLPFLFLISKHPKRIKAVLAGAAVWMLVMHLIDVYWMVMPIVPIADIAGAESYAALVADINSGEIDTNYGFHLLDITTVVGLAGLLLWRTFAWLGQCSLVPEQDPRFEESLAFENM